MCLPLLLLGLHPTAFGGSSQAVVSNANKRAPVTRAMAGGAIASPASDLIAASVRPAELKVCGKPSTDMCSIPTKVLCLPKWKYADPVVMLRNCADRGLLLTHWEQSMTASGGRGSPVTSDFLTMMLQAMLTMSTMRSVSRPLTPRPSSVHGLLPTSPSAALTSSWRLCHSLGPAFLQAGLPCDTVRFSCTCEKGRRTG